MTPPLLADTIEVDPASISRIRVRWQERANDLIVAT